jgi:hypothetical protein
MSGRSQSGPIVLHYAPYLIGRTEADTLAGKIDGSLYVAESYCSFDLIEPIHFFLYPSERAVRAEIMFETDDRDPKHREFHIVYAPDFDLAPELCTQIVFDLQEKLNRHAGAHWVDIALPVAVTGRLPIASAGRTVDIDCDDAVRALVASSGLVKLDYLRNDELSEYVSEEVRNAELGSFLRWVHAHYSIDEFQQVITQPNIDLILNSDTEQLESDWLQSLQEGNSLISDPRRAAEWAAGIPASPLLAGVQLPLDMLKEGIRLYLGGEEIMGKRQILHAIEIDPGMGLGYYTLGWIACRENNWDEAKQQLTMALMLLESPEEIAWCHAYLVPIYIRESRWDLAQASLAIVATTIRSPGVRQWAQSLLTRISHLMSLQPTQPVDRASQTFDQMRRFMLAWNQAANSRDGVASLISPLMDQVRAGELTSFYKSIRDRCPGVMFNHALQTVGTSGSALLIEVRIQAAMPEGSPDLPPGVETIKEEGYVRYFQLIPVGEGWQVQDWEDATFPSASAGFLMGTNLQIEGLEPGAGTGNP